MSFKETVNIALFRALPYKKVCFTNKHTDYGEFVCVPGFENEPYVGDILRYDDIFGTRIFEKHFDLVAWINQ